MQQHTRHIYGLTIVVLCSLEQEVVTVVLLVGKLLNILWMMSHWIDSMANAFTLCWPMELLVNIYLFKGGKVSL